jgi:hypothetical protein
MVDEAKAFCPGCGYSFEDEQKRKADSEFEATGGTVQFSKSAFNMLLSDMGLNISEAPNPTENKAVDLSPIPAHQPENNTPKNPATGQRTLIIVLIALLILSILGVLIAAAVLYVIFFRNF